jgi:hypothetical protein
MPGAIITKASAFLYAVSKVDSMPACQRKISAGLAISSQSNSVKPTDRLSSVHDDPGVLAMMWAACWQLLCSTTEPRLTAHATLRQGQQKIWLRWPGCHHYPNLAWVVLSVS